MPRDLVRVFEHDPELLRDLPPRAAQEALLATVAEVIRLERGEWRAPVVRLGRGDLGLLILDGVTIRRIEVAGHAGTELLGAGDLLLPWTAGDDDASVPSLVSVKVYVPTRLALLDRAFVATISRWPEIMPQLLERLSARSAGLAFQLAIAQLPQLEHRLLYLLWHLADRWGRVDREGVVLRLPLSQETLADLTSSRRASVSAALGRLAARGLVERPARGEYRLHGGPPSEPDGVAAALPPAR